MVILIAVYFFLGGGIIGWALGRRPRVVDTLRHENADLRVALLFQCQCFLDHLDAVHDPDEQKRAAAQVAIVKLWVTKLSLLIKEWPVRGCRWTDW